MKRLITAHCQLVGGATGQMQYMQHEVTLANWLHGAGGGTSIDATHLQRFLGLNSIAGVFSRPHPLN